MSLLDRVQRKAEGTPTPSHTEPPRQRRRRPPHRSATPGRRERSIPAPAGWQQRQDPRPAAPAARSRRRARSPRDRSAPAGRRHRSRPFEASGPPRLPKRRARRRSQPHSGAIGLNRPGSEQDGRPHQYACRAPRQGASAPRRGAGAGARTRVPPEPCASASRSSLNDVITEQNITMSRPDRLRLVEILINDVLGLGPLEELLRDRGHHRNHDQQPQADLR